MAEKQLRHTAAQVDSAVDKANSALQEHQKLKTINGESIVGEGNITIEGGGGGLTPEQVEALGQVSELSLKVGELNDLADSVKAETIVGAINKAAHQGGGGLTPEQEAELAKIPTIESNQVTINEIKEVMESLPDGSAVSAQVAINTQDITDIVGIHVDEDVEKIDAVGLIYTTNKWKKTFPCYLYDISKARGGKLTYNGKSYKSTYNACAILASFPDEIVNDVTDVDYAEGCSRVQTNNVKVFESDIPNDAKWLWVDAQGANGDIPVVHITKQQNGVLDGMTKHTDDEIARIEGMIAITDADEVDAILAENEIDNLTSASTKAMVRNRNSIKNDIADIEKYVRGSHNPDFDYSNEKVLDGMVYGVWKASPNTTHRYYSVAVNVYDYRGRTFKVKCISNSTYLSSALVTSLDLVAEQSLPLCDGTTIIDCRNEIEISIPNDANYLIVDAAGTDSQFWAPSIKLVEDITGVEERLDFQNKGKSIAIFGGSWAANGINTIAPIWKKILHTDKVDNYAMGGAGFAGAQVSGAKSIPQQVDELCADDAELYDVYVLWASSNDFATPTVGIKIGTRDWYTDADEYDETHKVSQCGGINYCIKKLSEKNPQAQIVFFSSCPIFNVREGYDTTTKKNITANDGSVIKGSFADYIAGQRDCCDRFHIPFLDQWNMLGINEYNKLAYFPSTDLRHMNVYGYTRLAYKQAEWLKNCIG